MSATPSRYSSDLTREEIIARFRDRINAGKRSKLGKTELEQLILHFIERLKNLDEASAIKTLCDAEIALLEEGYAQSTLASDYIPKYRKTIEAAIASEIIPLTPTNSHRYLHSQRVTGKREERFEHYALTYFKYDEATYEALDSRSQQTNRQRQLNLQGVNPTIYLQKLTSLLHSQDKFASRHLAIAIAGLTGRRIGEVVARGRFSLSHHPYLLRFEGHSKGDCAPYDLVTLIEAASLLPQIERFRSSVEIQPFLNLEGESLTNAINQYDVQVNRECKKHLSDIVPPLDGRDGISVHNLRSLWGAIAAYFFCPPTSHEYPFLQHYLGHVLESPATGHYFRYRLIDESGRFLDERGILLSQSDELPLPGAPPTDEGLSARAIDTSRKEPSPSVAIDDPQQQLTLPLGADSQSARSLSLLPALDEDEILSQKLACALATMLESERYTVLLAALMAVTGRSPGELLKSGTFEPITDEDFTVLFSPTGVGAKSKLICLVESSVVRDAIARLRSHQDTQSLRYLSPSALDAHCQLYVAKAVAQYLPFDNLEAMGQAYSSFTQSAAASMPTAKPHLSTAVYNLYNEDKQRLVSLAQGLGFDGTQPEVFHAFLDWVESMLRRDDVSPSTLSSDRIAISETFSTTINHQAQTLAWLTSEVESLRNSLEAVQRERDDLKSNLEQASQPAPVIELLQAENHQLKSQLQQERAKLDSLSELLLGNERPPAKSSTLKVTSPSCSSRLPKLISQGVENKIDSSPSNSLSAQVEASVHSTDKPQVKKAGSAVARAKQIFQAIQQWNQLHSDDLFAVNRGLLETVFGINRKAVGIFTDTYCDVLEQYHQSLSISPFSHNRGKDTTQLKAFVNQMMAKKSHHN